MGCVASILYDVVGMIIVEKINLVAGMSCGLNFIQFDFTLSLSCMRVPD